MNKWESFGWGFLTSLIGGFLVFILFYLLYLKKKRVDLKYYVVGFFSIAIVLFAVLGSVAVFGVLGGSISA